MSRTEKDEPILVKVIHGKAVLKVKRSQGVISNREAKSIAQYLLNEGIDLNDTDYYAQVLNSKNSVCPGCTYCTESKKNDPYINHGKLRLITQYANGSGLDDMWEM